MELAGGTISHFSFEDSSDSRGRAVGVTCMRLAQPEVNWGQSIRTSQLCCWSWGLGCGRWTVFQYRVLIPVPSGLETPNQGDSQICRRAYFSFTRGEQAGDFTVETDDTGLGTQYGTVGVEGVHSLLPLCCSEDVFGAAEGPVPLVPARSHHEIQVNLTPVQRMKYHLNLREGNEVVLFFVDL